MKPITSKSGTCWRENCEERGTLWRESCDERGMLWREKKLGEICHIVARKLPSLTNRGAPMNTSNWFLIKIKITDCKLNHVHLRYKLPNTQTSETIALSHKFNQLTSHFLKPGNRCWKLSHCKSKIKSGLTNFPL